MSDYIGGFGWIPTPLEKKPKQIDIYGWQIFIPFVATSVNVEVTLDPVFSQWYNQGNHGSCTAAASTQLMAALNRSQNGLEWYDIWATYCEICRRDKDKNTSCEADRGSYLYAAWDTSIALGAYIKNEGWKLDRGIASYRWISGSGVVDQCRTAHAQGLLTNDGVPWFSGWTKSNLVFKNSRWYLPERSKWGRVAGGHSIGKYGALDSLDVFIWENTWGWENFPRVCVSYLDWEYLITQVGGECTAIVDKAFVPPGSPSLSQSPSISTSSSPSPSPESPKEYVDLSLKRESDGKNFIGQVIEVRN